MANAKMPRLPRIAPSAFGIRHSAFGIWHLAFGIWHLAFGIWHLAFGIWHLCPVVVEFRARLRAVGGQRPLLADGVRTNEDPVLPRREAAEDLGLHRLRPGEAQVRFH